MSLKHCHFSILYNELPFLKQKLPFLYKNFEQIIFYDLNVGITPHEYSTDGSHEYILNYPDPEKKIFLIEEKCLNKVKTFLGHGSLQKQKMFSLGSKYVKNDIDVFWCTDMDEFFNSTLIKKVEDIFIEKKEINSIDLEHYVFWKDFNHIVADKNTNLMRLYSRIARHKPGNLYSHCAIQEQFKCYYINSNEQAYFHFAWLGDTRVRLKLKNYSTPPFGNSYLKPIYENYIKEVWEKRKNINISLNDTSLYMYPDIHPSPNLKKGVRRYDQAIPMPDYINYEELFFDLECDKI